MDFADVLLWGSEIFVKFSFGVKTMIGSAVQQRGLTRCMGGLVERPYAIRLAYLIALDRLSQSAMLRAFVRTLVTCFVAQGLTLYRLN